MHGRPFPYEGYFPVAEISSAVFATGFRGYTVMEVFEDDAFDPRKGLLGERTNRAVGAWVRLGKEIGLAPFHPPTPKGQNKLGTCTVNIGDYEHYALEGKSHTFALCSGRAELTCQWRSRRQAVRVRGGWAPGDRPVRGRLPALPQNLPRLDQGQLVGGKQTLVTVSGRLWLQGLTLASRVQPNAVHLHAAKQLGDLIAALGMELICFQPLIDVEGLTKQADRDAAVQRVKNYFPYMRALRTNVTYITTNRAYDDSHTDDMQVIAKDLAFFADLAAEYAKADGGPMLKIGYEHLSWGRHINTFDKTWEAIQLADRPNLGFVFDTFNVSIVLLALRPTCLMLTFSSALQFLAVEYADPYNPVGHGRIHDTPEESLRVVRERLAKLAKLIPGDKIYVVQVADAALVDPKSLKPPTAATEKWTPEHEPPHRQWSTSHRLFPNEEALGGYMPVADCLAAILATGYKGAFTLEIFNDSIHEKNDKVVPTHARRSYAGVEACVAEARGEWFAAEYVARRAGS
jgi:4-hydroxyphenylpyruvate dioxygenase